MLRKRSRLTAVLALAALLIASVMPAGTATAATVEVVEILGAATSGTSWTVPAGVSAITFRAWGGGGGGGGGGDDEPGGHGGGGGYAGATVAVTAGETLTFRVGGGGAGGGGVTYSYGWARVGNGGGGGGFTGVFRGSTPLIIAAGGGGGGGGDNENDAPPGGDGGAGGGTNGTAGFGGGGSYGGGGGTQSAGGSAGGGAGSPTAGGSLVGGNGGKLGSSTTMGGTNGGGAGGSGADSGRPGGGGGGAGYFGGGGGGAAAASERSAGGGGGGSSFTTGTSTSTLSGSDRNAGNNSSTTPYYDNNAGQGGLQGSKKGNGAAGNPGRLHITYAITQWTVTVTKTGDGTITPDVGSYIYPNNSPLTLSATAEAGWRFDKWVINGVDNSNPAPTLTITADTTLHAVFIQQFKLTTTVAPGGAGTVATVPAAGPFDAGSTVQLTATASPGRQFAGWTGDLVSSDNPGTLTMNADKSVTAFFTLTEHTLTVNTVGLGSVVRTPDYDHYHYGDVVGVDPQAAPGWTFTHWSGHLTDPGARTITMDADKAITAHFEQDTYTVTTGTAGGGSGTVTLDPKKLGYIYDEVVTVTATPDVGSYFSHWQEISEENAEFDLQVEGDTTLTAWFELLEYDITVTWIGDGEAGHDLEGDGPYEYGTAFTLTATPDDGWLFDYWMIGEEYFCTPTLPWILEGDTHVTAVFVQATPHTLIVAHGGTGSGTTDPDVGTYHLGDQDMPVKLSASAAAGSTFARWEVTTDLEGSYTETYTASTISIEFTGAAKAVAYFTIIPPPPPPSPTGQLSVTVVKSDGASAAGITVVIGGAIGAHITTNASGVATLGGLAAGTYTANASAAGYTSDGPKTIVLATDADTGSATITLTSETAPGAIAGTVTDATTGLPIAGALVTVTVEGGAAFATTTTAADGTYSVADVPAGTYTVAGTATGYEPGQTAVVVNYRTTSTANLALAAVQVIVQPPTPPETPVVETPELPKTGMSYTGFALLGGCLLACGLAVGASRRRGR
jgi:LPXTG-motif cell wall-anchored protein